MKSRKKRIIAIFLVAVATFAVAAVAYAGSGIVTGWLSQKQTEMRQPGTGIAISDQSYDQAEGLDAVEEQNLNRYALELIKNSKPHWITDMCISMK